MGACTGVGNEGLLALMEQTPHVSWKTAALTKEINPDISIQLNGGLRIKFHPICLEQVICMEKQMGLVQAVPPSYWQ